MDVDTVTRNHIELDFGQDILEGALAYKIQRQYAKSNSYAQDESKSIQLLVAWHVEYTKGLDVRALLVEYDEKFNWDEDKLGKLYQKYWHPLDVWSKLIKCNWLLNDAKLLTITAIVMNGGYRCDIFISEERTYNRTMKPLWIDTEK
jgi:hypothetical protein